ncbi:MAG: T9SS type A sorting domain-containing protein [Bacteroidetes bacterium]|nr:T9SS type A sorting domain-containing protein [Bacteroidota bacterium]
MLYSSPAQRWEEYIGEPGTTEVAKDVIDCYDQGYLLSGGFEKHNIIRGWFIKTDINGQILWDKEVHHAVYDLQLFSTVQDDQGYTYACGVIILDDTWPLIMKLDACGELQWCKVYRNNNYDWGWASDILITNENKLIVLTTLQSIGNSNEQIFLLGIETEGEILWLHPYASKNNYPLIDNAGAYSILQHMDKYIITGRCYWPYPDDPYHVFLRPLYICIDSEFNEEWIIPFGVADSIHGKSFVTIPLNDSVYMGAVMWRKDPVITTLLTFYDNNGNELGYAEIPNDSIEPGVSQNFVEHIERVNDSLFLTTGSIGYNGEYFPRGDMVIDTAGKVYNFALRPPPSSQGNLIKTYNNKFVVGSGVSVERSNSDIYMYKMDENLESVPIDTVTYTYDSLCEEQIESGIIDITDCLIVVGTEEIPTPQQYVAQQRKIKITPYPNPAHSHITFKLENTENFQNIELSCFDTFGRRVHSSNIIKMQNEYSLKLSGWNSGAYIAIVKSNGRIVGRCAFVVN